MKPDLERLTVAFRDLFGDTAPASRQALSATLEQKRESHAGSVETLSQLLAELPFDAVQGHLAAQGFEAGALPFLARSGGAAGVGALAGAQASAPPEAAKLEDALRALSESGDASEVGALLARWDARSIREPVRESVRNGTKVTLEIEYRGRTLVLSYNPAARVATTLLDRASMARVPLGVFVTAARAGAELDTTGLAKPTVGFVVSRVGGEDGVSLEVMHWIRIYQQQGFDVHIFTGERTASRELTQLEQLGVTVQEMPLANPNPRDDENIEEFEKLHVPGKQDPAVIEERLLPRANKIEESLERWIANHGIEFLHAENFTLPFYHLAMGVAVARAVSECGIPTASRGHDFPDDRDDIYHWNQTLPETRELVNRTYMRSPSVGSITINTKDVKYFAARGIHDVMVVPNTINVHDPRVIKQLSEARKSELKKALLGRDDPHTFIALAPVRPVSRKRLDVGLQFLKLTLAKLREHDPEAKIAMVITHDEVDGKPNELAALERAAREIGIELIYGHRQLKAYNESQWDERKWFETWDQYHVGDLACYFSDYEGWGNALLETLACRVPTYVNEYQVFRDDIADRVDVPSVTIDPSFDFRDFLADGMATFDGRDALNAQLSAAADDAVAMLVAKGEPGKQPTGKWAERAEKNHQAVCEHYSYEVIGKQLVDRMYSAFSATVKC